MGEGEMKPPAVLELIHLYTCLIGKRGCTLNLIKIMIDDRKIVIFPFGKGGGGSGGEMKPPSGLEYVLLCIPHMYNSLHFKCDSNWT